MTGLQIYLLTVGVIGALTTLVLQLLFRRAEQIRKADVEDLRRFVAVRTESEEKNRASQTKAIALESIETRFAILRRLSVPVVLTITGLLIAIPFFGRLPGTLISLLVTAVTIIIGIAFKPVLENVIAGLMISFGQPLRIGDVVRISGHYGLVENIFLTYTVIKVWDFRRFVIPNNRLLQTEYVNYTLHDKWQWAYVPFWVALDADLSTVEELALEAVETSEHHCQGQPTGFWVIEVGKEGVLCWVAGWAEHPFSAWSLRHEIARSLLPKLRDAGIRGHTYFVEGGGPGVIPSPPPSAAAVSSMVDERGASAPDGRSD